MRPLAFLFFQLCFLSAIAQSFPYQLVVDSEPYEDLQNATELLSGEVWDDPMFALPIGFEFNYFGQPVDSLFQIDLGSGFVFKEAHIDAPDSVSIPLLFPYVSDIIDRGIDIDSSLSPISYLVEGEPGSRIFKLEYKNAGFFEDVSMNDFVNFQMWMYEGSGDIELRFGPNQVNDFENSHFDWGGPSSFLIRESFYFDDGDGGIIYDWGYISGTNGAFTLMAIDSLNLIQDPFGLIDPMEEDPLDGTVFRFSNTITHTNRPYQLAELNIFPTLTSEQVQVVVPEAGVLEVLSLNGRRMWSEDLLPGQSSLQVSTWPAGHYFVNLKSGEKMYIARFVKK